MDREPAPSIDRAGDLEFDPYSPEVKADPARAHAELRERCPFAHVPYGERGFYVVARHADVTEVLRDPVLWSTGLGSGVRYQTREPRMLQASDPPAHTAQRRLINKAFTPRMVAEMEPRIRALANELVDDFIQRGTADLVTDFAYPLPVIVIAEMLGVSRADRATFKRWSDDMVAGQSGAEGTIEPDLRAREEFNAYFAEALARRRDLEGKGEGLPDDLVSALFLADYEGRRLDEAQALNTLQQLLVAGNETTTSLLSNLFYRLFQHPAQLARVRDEPALAEAAVEESLRFDSPVQGLFRTNSRPTTVHGVELEQDTKVMVLYASANRDAEVWDDPDEFRIDRDLTELRRHFAFGHGVHLCLGAPLARLEGRIGVQTLLARLPGLRPVGEPELMAPMLMRGFKRMPIAWEV